MYAYVYTRITYTQYFRPSKPFWFFIGQWSQNTTVALAPPRRYRGPYIIHAYNVLRDITCGALVSSPLRPNALETDSCDGSSFFFRIEKSKTNDSLRDGRRRDQPPTPPPRVVLTRRDRARARPLPSLLTPPPRRRRAHALCIVLL